MFQFIKNTEQKRISFRGSSLKMVGKLVDSDYIAERNQAPSFVWRKMLQTDALVESSCSLFCESNQPSLLFHKERVFGTLQYILHTASRVVILNANQIMSLPFLKSF